MQYDKNNVFYKIIHGEIKSNIIVNGEHYIAIHDIAPKAPVHVLVISKGEYTDWFDFATKASDSEIIEFNKGIAKVIDMMGLKKGGYKLAINAGSFGNQEVMHLHVHIMGKPALDDY